MIFCEIALSVGLSTSAAKPIRKKNMKIASKSSIASKSINYLGDLSWDSAVSHVSDASLASSVTIYDEIDQMCADPESYEEGEPSTQSATIAKLKGLLTEAESVLSRAIPIGEITPYFGELNVTWLHGPRMLRLSVFPDDQPAILVFGSAPKAGALGSFASDPAVNSEQLAARLDWLDSGDERGMQASLSFGSGA